MNAALVVGLTLVLGQEATLPVEPEPTVAVDVVVALETSAVMKPVLDSLQQNAWSLARRACGDTEVRLGFVFYRAGEAPEAVALTHELGPVVRRLREITATGNGGPAPLGEALRLAVEEMSWRKGNSNLGRRQIHQRRIVIIGRDDIGDLALAARALKAATAADIGVHALTALPTPQHLTHLVTTNGGTAETLELSPPGPIPRTKHDAALLKAITRWAELLVFAGPPEASAETDKALAQWRATPSTELLEQASYRAACTPFSQPFFEPTKGVVLLIEALDDLASLLPEHRPMAQRKWSEAQLRRWAEKTANAMDTRDDQWRDLASARSWELTKHPVKDPVVGAIARTVWQAWPSKQRPKD